VNEEIKMVPVVHTLFVWDFDWTIVNCNSDEYIPGQFIQDENELNTRFQQLYESTQQDWHACVQAIIRQVMEQSSPYRSTPDAIMTAARKMPYLTGVRSALDIVYNCRTTESSGDGGGSGSGGGRTTGQMILSDGNTLFIGAFLEANGLNNHFTHGVISNEGKWIPLSGDSDDQKDTIQLEVVHQSQQYGGHSCDRCPKNLCKTQALQHVLEQHFSATTCDDEKGTRKNRPQRIVYVGDGANDACPALHVLTESDVLLARTGRKRRNANGRAGPETDKEAMTDGMQGGTFGILSALRNREQEGGEMQRGPKCQVLEWSTGDELMNHVTKLIEDLQAITVQE